MATRSTRPVQGGIRESLKEALLVSLSKHERLFWTIVVDYESFGLSDVWTQGGFWRLELE